LPIVLNDGRTRGFPVTRFIADMAWVLKDPAAMDHLLEFECRANLALPKAGDIVICAYELDKFSAGIIIDALRTHPIVLIGGIVQRNPFYVPPEELLKELNERESPETGRTTSA
jgi:MEDS: MEthanogen/methylotroph, DcmR Sensory domain